MSRLIDADALKEKYIMATIKYGSRGSIMERPVVLLEHIVDAPTIDAVEVVHGEWIERIGGISKELFYQCSKCYGEVDENVFDYCPWCGAKMDGEREGE